MIHAREDAAMPRLITCKVCKGEVSSDARKCPHCGASRRGFSVLRVLGLLGCLGFGLLGFAFPAAWIIAIICPLVACFA